MIWIYLSLSAQLLAQTPRIGTGYLDLQDPRRVTFRARCVTWRSPPLKQRGQSVHLRRSVDGLSPRAGGPWNSAAATVSAGRAPEDRSRPRPGPKPPRSCGMPSCTRPGCARIPRTGNPPGCAGLQAVELPLDGAPPLEDLGQGLGVRRLLDCGQVLPVCGGDASPRLLVLRELGKGFSDSSDGSRHLVEPTSPRGIAFVLLELTDLRQQEEDSSDAARRCSSISPPSCLIS